MVLDGDRPAGRRLDGHGHVGRAPHGRLDACRRSAGSVVTLLCDGGERYAETYYDDDWLERQGIDIAPYTATLEGFYETGTWEEPSR